MKTFLYKAKNCTDLADCDYAIDKLNKMILISRANGSPTVMLSRMLANVYKKQQRIKVKCGILPKSFKL